MNQLLIILHILAMLPCLPSPPPNVFPHTLCTLYPVDQRQGSDCDVGGTDILHYQMLRRKWRNLDKSFGDGFSLPRSLVLTPEFLFLFNEQLGACVVHQKPGTDTTTLATATSSRSSFSINWTRISSSTVMTSVSCVNCQRRPDAVTLSLVDFTHLSDVRSVSIEEEEPAHVIIVLNASNASRRTGAEILNSLGMSSMTTRKWRLVCPSKGAAVKLLEECRSAGVVFGLKL